MTPERLLHIRTGRHPHEIFVLVATVIVGVIGMFIPAQVSPSVAAVLHGWPAHGYYLTLASFSAVSLYGIFRSKIEGLLIERVGLAVVAIFYGIFGYCVFAYYGLGGFMGALLPVAYTLANVARIWQIGIDLSLLKSYLADHPGASGFR